MLEVGAAATTPYPYLTGDSTATGYARYSPLHPYDASGVLPLPWFPVTAPAVNRTLPWSWQYDRQVAQAQRVSVAQGRYVCANSGKCTAPGVCECAAGWSGFDCRTPICGQGYYDPAQTSFTVSSSSVFSGSVIGA
jgi:hypothetical protein